MGHETSEHSKIALKFCEEKLPSVVIWNSLSKARILGEDPVYFRNVKFEMSLYQRYVFKWQTVVSNHWFPLNITYILAFTFVLLKNLRENNLPLYFLLSRIPWHKSYIWKAHESLFNSFFKGFPFMKSLASTKDHRVSFL